MRIRDYIANVLWEIIYLGVMAVYLVKLNMLNQELVSRDFGGAFELLQYKNYAPLTYFGIAAVLFLVGCLLIWREIRHITWEMDTFQEIIVSCLAIIVTFVLLILLIIFIDNPILRSIFVAGLVVLGIVNVNTH